MRCRIVPGDMVPCLVVGVWLYGDGGGGVIFRCPFVRIVVKGVKGDGVVVFQLWNTRRAWRPCRVSLGGRG